ncbi:HAD-IA family hydrolase [Arthrobacter sp. ISL-30]|uniref:HAD-IA family hydrolase n=1 Tax=Arthrobacter sp. ISL-30 TaxID=2819109 RepID=UPI002035023B|nr:HAD-IA family hydrolase [Arthrobacter sp. ISL-30]
MGLDDAVEHVMAGMAGLGLHPDVATGVKALKEGGYRLITSGNGSVQVAEELLAPTGIRAYFDYLLSVDNAPAWKPAPSSYEYAAWICGVTPQQMLLVAVHSWDIHGASVAGLGKAWLNRFGGPYPGYFAAPDHTLTTLTGLLPALKSKKEPATGRNGRLPQLGRPGGTTAPAGQ